MEYVFDCDIVGEIMIPLENNLEGGKNKDINKFMRLDSILSQNYKDFRSILFQGELLRLFVVIKLDANSSMNVNELMENLYVKFEFDPSCDQNEIELKKGDENSVLLEDNESSQLMADFDKSNFDMFSLHRNSLFNNFSGTKNAYNYKNLNYDFISRRVYLEERKICIFEVIRHISILNK